MNPPFNRAGAKPVAGSWPRLAHVGIARYAAALGRDRGAAAAAGRRADADLARRRARCGAGGARRRFRRASRFLPIHPQPEAPAIRVLVARRQGKPRAARAVAGLGAHRCRSASRRGSRSGLARGRGARAWPGVSYQSLLICPLAAAARLRYGNRKKGATMQRRIPVHRDGTAAAQRLGSGGRRIRRHAALSCFLGRPAQWNVGNADDDADQHKQHVNFHCARSHPSPDIAASVNLSATLTNDYLSGARTTAYVELHERARDWAIA